MSGEFLEAVRAGDLAAVRRELAADPGLAASTDPAGVSAVRTALYHRQPEVLAALLEHDPALDVFDAAALGRLEVLAKLLTAEPTRARAVAGDGFTPLHLAAFLGGATAVRTLLAAGADPNAEARNPSRVRPLHSAAAARDAEAVRLLLDAGADPDARQAGGFTALHSAAQHDDVAMAQALVAAGADVGLTAEDGRDALARLPPDADAAAWERLLRGAP